MQPNPESSAAPKPTVAERPLHPSFLPLSTLLDNKEIHDGNIEKVLNGIHTVNHHLRLTIDRLEESLLDRARSDYKDYLKQARELINSLGGDAKSLEGRFTEVAGGCVDWIPKIVREYRFTISARLLQAEALCGYSAENPVDPPVVENPSVRD